MAWCSCLQRLAQETSSTGFICRVKLQKLPVWRISIPCHSLISCSILFFFLIFPVFNVAIFLTSGYLGQNFIVLCHTSLPRKIAWANVLSIVGDYSQFILPIKKKNQQLKFRGGLHRWYKVFLGRVYYAWFLVCIFEIKSEIFFCSSFIYGDSMFNHIIIPRSQKNVTWFRYIWWRIRLLLDNCPFILAFNHNPYRDRDNCYPYNLSWWCSVIALK